MCSFIIAALIVYGFNRQRINVAGLLPTSGCRNWYFWCSRAKKKKTTQSARGVKSSLLLLVPVYLNPSFFWVFHRNLSDTWVDPGPVFRWCFFGLLGWAERWTDRFKVLSSCDGAAGPSLLSSILAGSLQGSSRLRSAEAAKIMWHFQTNVGKKKKISFFQLNVVDAALFKCSDSFYVRTGVDRPRRSCSNSPCINLVKPRTTYVCRHAHNCFLQLELIVFYFVYSNM